MPTQIHAENRSLSTIFDKSFSFWIPAYQRPYAWEVEHVETLINDLQDFRDGKTEDGYFLGSVVLIKKEQEVEAEVIDGQQRLTTLTILIACLAERARELEDPEYDVYREYLYEKGNKHSNLQEKMRLTLRDQDQPFFKKHIQEMRIDDLMKLDPKKLATDAQRNITANALYLREQVRERFPDLDALDEFMSFLMRDCFLVVVSTPTRDSAFRVFSTMNSRGLDLRPTDILKSKVLGGIPKTDLSAYSDKWEAIEDNLGREEFNNLFGHIRTLHRAEKQRGTLLAEFETLVLSQYSDRKAFIDNVIAPYAKAYGEILRKEYKASMDADRVNRALVWLSRIDHGDWVPPALEILVRHGERGSDAADLMEALERLAAWLLICHQGASKRITRYGKVATGVAAASATKDDETPLSDMVPDLRLTSREVQELVEWLDDDIYSFSRKRMNYIILRLNDFMSDGGVVYGPKMLTIEHVLPQTVAEDSQWAEWWPDEEEREEWVHRLANLVALNRQRNSAAGNKELEDKVKTYFSGNKGVPSYELTVKMMGAKSWKPADLRKRQKQLLNLMLDSWNLERPARGRPGLASA